MQLLFVKFLYSRKFLGQVPCTLYPVDNFGGGIMFTYEHGETEQHNFEKWRWMNRTAREELGVAPLSEEEARWVFNQLKESGWLTTSQSEDDPRKLVSS